MANVISATFSADVAFGTTFTDSVPSISSSWALGAVGKSDLVVAALTTGVTLTISITTLGWAYIQNLDTVNFVSMRITAESNFLKLKAGEWCWVRLVPGTTYKLYGDTATVNTRVMVFND